MRAPGDGRPSSFVRIADAASRAAGWLASAALLAMLGMICFDVIMRYVFNEPTVWATEISTYVLVAVALLGCAETHRLDGHIRVELLVTQLDPARRRRLLLAACWAGTLFVAFAAWQATVLTVDNWSNGTRNFSLLYTPIYLPQIPMAAGFVLFLPAMLAEARRRWHYAAGWLEGGVAARLAALGGVWAARRVCNHTRRHTRCGAKASRRRRAQTPSRGAAAQPRGAHGRRHRV